ncbi:ABC [Ectocarpus sp. CCAP 1310/34]|nr:ABC [Ectocarpus sp. CCAP 1310/34]
MKAVRRFEAYERMPWAFGAVSIVMTTTAVLRQDETGNQQEESGTAAGKNNLDAHRGREETAAEDRQRGGWWYGGRRDGGREIRGPQPGEALDACALGADLASIPGGDTAYVGERGATLSGGQRLRVSLARQARKGGVFSVFLGLAGFRSRATYCEPPTSHTLSHESNICEGAMVLNVKWTQGLCAQYTYVRAKARDWQNKVYDLFPRCFLRCTPMVRCAYFVSAAAVADVAAKSAALGNNLPGDDDTKSGTALADDNDGGDGGDVHHSAGTLCLLDNPLTSLDAETREHVLQHCIHGVMRRGNPGVAVVVTCGEIDPAEKEQPTATKERGATVPPLPLSPSIKRSFDRVVRLGGIGGEGTRLETAADAGEGKLPLPGADASAERRRAPPPAAATSPSVLISAPKPTSEAASSRPAAPAAAPQAAEKVTSNLVKHASGGGGGGGGCCPEIQGAGRSSEGDGLADSSGDVLLPCGGSEALEAGDGNGGSGPVEEEDRKDGSVEFRVYLLYVRSAGLGVAAVTLLSLALMQATAAGFSYWLSHWATQQGRVSVRSFLATSFSIAAANAAFTLVRAFGFAFGGVRAAVALHRRLLSHVLGKPSAFFDVTPSGRVVNRFSRDAFSVDDPLPFHLNVLLAQAAGLSVTAVVLSSASPVLAALFLPLGWVYAKLQRYYRSSSRELRRLDSTSRSPIYALFSETLDGAVTIRAFGQQEAFFERFVDLLAENQRATFAGSMASAWLSLRLQGLGVVVVAAVAFLAVAQQQLRGGGGRDEALGESLAAITNNPNSYYGLVGLSLTYALPIVGAI